jgi:hypothetical protein
MRSKREFVDSDGENKVDAGMEVGTPAALASISKLPAAQRSQNFQSALEAIAQSQHLRKPSEQTTSAIPVIFNIRNSPTPFFILNSSSFQNESWNYF